MTQTPRATQTPQTTQTPETTPTSSTRRRPAPIVIVFGVLAIVLVVSVIITIMVALPPSYEPVPIPSVSRT